MSRPVPPLEALVIDEVAAWVSQMVTESLATWVRHSHAAGDGSGGSPTGEHGRRLAASEALRGAVDDLTSSLGAWMDGLAERRARLAAQRADSVALERALRTYGTLTLRVRAASDVGPSAGTDGTGASQLLIELLVRGEERRTRGVPVSASPRWDEPLAFEGELGALLEHPAAVRLLEAGGPGESGAALLCEGSLPLCALLTRAEASLSGTFDALPLRPPDEGPAGARARGVTPSLCVEVSFAPAELGGAVLGRQQGRLVLKVETAAGLPLAAVARAGGGGSAGAGAALELCGVFFAVSAGGQRRRTAAISGAAGGAAGGGAEEGAEEGARAEGGEGAAQGSVELEWGERLAFDGRLGDFARAPVRLQLCTQEPAAAAEGGAGAGAGGARCSPGGPDSPASAPGGGGGLVVCEGHVRLPASLAELELMTEEPGGLRVQVELRLPGGSGCGSLLLCAEWTPNAQPPVAEPLAAAFPHLRAALAIRRLKRDVPIEALLAHPLGLAAFRRFLARAGAREGGGLREALRCVDAYAALADFRADCTAAEAAGAGPAGAARVAEGAQALWRAFLAPGAPQPLELAAGARQRLGAAVSRGRFSAATFCEAEQAALDSLGPRHLRAFVASAAFGELLRSLCSARVAVGQGGVALGGADAWGRAVRAERGGEARAGALGAPLRSGGELGARGGVANGGLRVRTGEYGGSAAAEAEARAAQAEARVEARGRAEPEPGPRAAEADAETASEASHAAHGAAAEEASRRAEPQRPRPAQGGPAGAAAGGSEEAEEAEEADGPGGGASSFQRARALLASSGVVGVVSAGQTQRTPPPSALARAGSTASGSGRAGGGGVDCGGGGPGSAGSAAPEDAIRTPEGNWSVAAAAARFGGAGRLGSPLDAGSPRAGGRERSPAAEAAAAARARGFGRQPHTQPQPQTHPEQPQQPQSPQVQEQPQPQPQPQPQQPEEQPQQQTAARASRGEAAAAADATGRDWEQRASRQGRPPPPPTQPPKQPQPQQPQRSQPPQPPQPPPQQPPPQQPQQQPEAEWAADFDLGPPTPSDAGAAAPQPQRPPQPQSAPAFGAGLGPAAQPGCGGANGCAGGPAAASRAQPAGAQPQQPQQQPMQEQIQRMQQTQAAQQQQQRQQQPQRPQQQQQQQQSQGQTQEQPQRPQQQQQQQQSQDQTQEQMAQVRQMQAAQMQRQQQQAQQQAQAQARQRWEEEQREAQEAQALEESLSKQEQEEQVRRYQELQDQHRVLQQQQQQLQQRQQQQRQQAQAQQPQQPTQAQAQAQAQQRQQQMQAQMQAQMQQQAQASSGPNPGASAPKPSLFSLARRSAGAAPRGGGIADAAAAARARESTGGPGAGALQAGGAGGKKRTGWFGSRSSQ